MDDGFILLAIIGAFGIFAMFALIWDDVSQKRRDDE